MTIRYTICHNDDDPKDPNHRRVVIDVRSTDEFHGLEDHDAKLIICADGESVDFAPLCYSEDEAEKTIKELWQGPYWDLRSV